MFAANDGPANIIKALIEGGLPQGNLASLPSPALTGNLVGNLPQSTPEMASSFFPAQVILEALSGNTGHPFGANRLGRTSGITGRPGGSGTFNATGA